jgi:hypothetical protein
MLLYRRSGMIPTVQMIKNGKTTAAFTQFCKSLKIDL